MPRDARLGFVVGVALVILIAVVFYHGDGKAGTAGSLAGADARKKDPASARQQETAGPVPSPRARVRTHVVAEGETLTSIAQKYYDDGSRDKALYAANKSNLRSIADVPIGTVLVIPDLPVR